MIETINNIFIIIGWIVTAVVIGTFIACGISWRPVAGVTKITFYDFGFVVINRREIDPTLLHNLYNAGYTIKDLNYPYSIAPSYGNYFAKYRQWRKDNTNE